jgi:hypothetical protein
LNIDLPKEAKPTMGCSAAAAADNDDDDDVLT